MKRYDGFLLVAVVFSAATNPARANEQDAKAILDKAIRALGGEEKLTKTSAHSWKANGKVSLGGAPEREFNTQGIANGLGQLRAETVFPRFRALVVLDGDKGWHRGGNTFTELTGDELANAKRINYLDVIPITLLPVKDKGFRCEPGGEEKVEGRQAVILKITAPDGKDFTLSFDKESGVPLKQVAKVIGLGGMAYTAETTFHDYKDFGGVQKATRILVKRDGEDWRKVEITEFKVLEKAEPGTFAEPK